MIPKFYVFDISQFLSISADFQHGLIDAINYTPRSGHHAKIITFFSLVKLMTVVMTIWLKLLACFGFLHVLLLTKWQRSAQVNAQV